MADAWDAAPVSCRYCSRLFSIQVQSHTVIIYLGAWWEGGKPERSSKHQLHRAISEEHDTVQRFQMKLEPKQKQECQVVHGGVYCMDQRGYNLTWTVDMMFLEERRRICWNLHAKSVSLQSTSTKSQQAAGIGTGDHLLTFFVFLIFLDSDAGTLCFSTDGLIKKSCFPRISWSTRSKNVRPLRELFEGPPSMQMGLFPTVSNASCPVKNYNASRSIWLLVMRLNVFRFHRRSEGCSRTYMEPARNLQYHSLMVLFWSCRRSWPLQQPKIICSPAPRELCRWGARYGQK